MENWKIAYILGMARNRLKFGSAGISAPYYYGVPLKLKKVFFNN